MPSPWTANAPQEEPGAPYRPWEPRRRPPPIHRRPPPLPCSRQRSRLRTRRLRSDPASRPDRAPEREQPSPAWRWGRFPTRRRRKPARLSVRGESERSSPRRRRPARPSNAPGQGASARRPGWRRVGWRRPERRRVGWRRPGWPERPAAPPRPSREAAPRSQAGVRSRRPSPEPDRLAWRPEWRKSRRSARPVRADEGQARRRRPPPKTWQPWVQLPRRPARRVAAQPLPRWDRNRRTAAMTEAPARSQGRSRSRRRGRTRRPGPAT